MKRLILLLLMCIPFLTACSQEEVVIYDLVVCDNKLASVWEHMTAKDISFAQKDIPTAEGAENIVSYFTTYEEHPYKINNINFDSASFSSFISVLTESEDEINSLTVYSADITDEQAVELIEFSRGKNIPVIFAIASVSADILNSYDKAFSVDTDYTHAAEIISEEMTDLWNDGDIVDLDENKIFEFSVIKDENLSEDLQIFLDNLIADIELYGIPLQINKEILSDEIDSVDTLSSIKSENEGLIVVTNSPLSYVNEYSSEGEGKEIVTVSHNITDIYEENSAVLSCYIDYNDYQNAVMEIITNFNNETYLLEDISYPFVDKTVYIPATF